MTRVQVALRCLGRHNVRVLASLAAAALIAWGLLLAMEQAVTRNKPTASDHDVMMNMLSQARDPALFDGEAPDRPTITGRPHPSRVELKVYGLIDPAAQDRVLARLQGPRDRPVVVNFYQQPPEMLPDPRGGGFLAGPVKLLREVTLGRSLAARPLKPGGTGASTAV